MTKPSLLRKLNGYQEGRLAALLDSPRAGNPYAPYAKSHRAWFLGYDDVVREEAEEAKLNLSFPPDPGYARFSDDLTLQLEPWQSSPSDGPGVLVKRVEDPPGLVRYYTAGPDLEDVVRTARDRP